MKKENLKIYIISFVSLLIIASLTFVLVNKNKRYTLLQNPYKKDKDSTEIFIPRDIDIVGISYSTNFIVKEFTFNLTETVKKQITIRGLSVEDRKNKFIQFIYSLNDKFQNCNRQIGLTENLNLIKLDTVNLEFSYRDGNVIFYPLLEISAVSNTSDKTIYIVSLEKVKINGTGGNIPNLNKAHTELGTVCRNFVKVFDCLLTNEK